MDSFCILPFIKLSNKHTGQFRVCCNQYHDYLHDENGKPMRMDTASIEEAWNSKDLREMRNQFLNGEKPSACKICWKEEAHGSFSMRQYENSRYMERYKQRIDEARETGGVLNAGPVSLDIRLGSVCNLACKSCFPVTSSSWAPQYKDLLEDDGYFNAHYSLYTYQSSLKWEKAIDVSQLLNSAESASEIYLAGGEPLLMPKARELIAGLVERGYASKIHLRFHTNLTHWSDVDFKLLSQFKKVSIQASIDGVGEVNDWIRFPSKWHVIEKNFESATLLKNAHFKVAVTLSVYNILHIEKLYTWYLEFKEKHQIPLSLDFSPIYEPPYLSLKNLPLSLKPHAIRKLEEIIHAEGESTAATELMYAVSMLRQDGNEVDVQRLKDFTFRVDRKTPGLFGKLFPVLFRELKLQSVENADLEINV